MDSDSMAAELGAALIMRAIRSAQNIEASHLLDLAADGCCVCGHPVTVLQHRWVPTQDSMRYRWLCPRQHESYADTLTWATVPVGRLRVVRVDDGTRE